MPLVFLYPQWLWLLPLSGLYLFYLHRRATRTSWAKLLAPQWLDRLLLPHPTPLRQRWWLVPAGVWILSILALAGPSWSRQQQPLFQSSAAWVLLLNLSPDMNATDLPPNRATQARYAIETLLQHAEDHRTALITWVDDPYTVCPLTEDQQTIRQFLPDLSPAIMPSSGKRLNPALQRAQRMLDHAPGHHHLIVLSAGLDDPDQSLTTIAQLRHQGIEVDVIGVGTPSGAPWPDAEGHWATAQGQLLISHLQEPLLRSLAQAGAGVYTDIHHLEPLLRHLQAHPQGDTTAPPLNPVATGRNNDGIWLLPALIALAATYVGSWL